MIGPNQETFDRVVAGLATQNFERSKESDSSACRYRGAGGRKCAIGWLIPDELYHPRFDITTSLAKVLLAIGVDHDTAVRGWGWFADLRAAHDAGIFPEQMRATLRAFAVKHHHTIPSVLEEQP